ncbi:magnesium transporter [Bacillus sp. OV166]|uniref:magnesium/cobalt transporter CorA n=1 Tax=unclassified Bacillus (in: firmicutes) TaxID=185979 RepID=UPI000A2AAB94|nr:MULTISPECIES: magnesium/cobalt transporter CorA [unclassified Bacillus (in: firmicutes)]PGY08501.1 magnesium and cobalt transport protein CorA [Bacillus sp. AFS031507]SMQ75712.1 magnesium transporter [Bacillus sp. OV166]
MIRTIAISQTNQLKPDLSIEELIRGDFLWYWIDFGQPTTEEIEFLRTPLSFHPLAIEDCVHTLQRPKLDYYEDYTFLVTQALNQQMLTREEIDFFLSKDYIITFHHNFSPEIDEVWKRITLSTNVEEWEPSHILYLVLDKMVDNYFPLVYLIEDRLNEIDENSKGRSMEALLEDLFDTRHHLLSLRHTITPMRDLIYRVLNSQRMTSIQGKREYYSDIHDHLLKLTEMIEANRELTTDIRDSYISINSHQTNHVMKVLTVITTIFMPLTFIAGLYGMNFHYMPELTWKYGYFATIGLMILVAIGMSLWFKKKGWFK